MMIADLDILKQIMVKEFDTFMDRPVCVSLLKQNIMVECLSFTLFSQLNSLFNVCKESLTSLFPFVPHLVGWIFAKYLVFINDSVLM